MSRAYRTIMKSTALVGSGQLLGMAVGIVQTKALASLLGPAGLGISGMYQSATALVGTVTGMGLGHAGIRQIAVSSRAPDSLARAVNALRWTALASGLLGMVIVFCFREAIGLAAFGDREHASGVGIMSLSLFFSGLASGEFALLTGLRRIQALTLCQILCAICSAGLSVALVYGFHEHGIAPYLAAGAAVAYATARWYARHLPCRPLRISASGLRAEVSALLRLGLAFMLTALFGAGVAFFARIIMVRQFGVAAVGLYAAVLSVSSLYVNMVMSAMSTDFYPSLTACANDRLAVNRLVNEQTEIGVLLITPGVLATLTLAPWLLRIFYSDAFVTAADVLQWQIVGVALRVVTWPLGFVLLAKGMAASQTVLSAALAGIELGLFYICARRFGMVGIGISYVAYGLVATAGLLAVCRAVTGFHWSRAIAAMVALSCGAVVAVWLFLRWMSPLSGLIGGLVASGLAAAASAVVLQRLLQIDVRHIIRRLLGQEPSA